MFAPYTAEVFFSLRIARMRRRHTLTYNGHLTRVKPLGAIFRLESTVIQCHYLAYLDPLVERFVIRPLISVSLALALLIFLVSCSGHTAGQPGPSPQLVELLPIELDSRNPQQKEFGRLEFLNGFQLRSRDRRFGGLSGLTIGADGRLYAVSDAGYWVSAQMIIRFGGQTTGSNRLASFNRSFLLQVLR